MDERACRAWIDPVMQRTGATRGTAPQQLLRVTLIFAAGWLAGASSVLAGDARAPDVPAAQLPDVTNIAPPPPTAQELAGGSLYDFIVHHGTTHAPAGVGAVGAGLLRWRGGRSESICPLTVGLSPGYDDFVTARIRAIGEFVGAPVDPNIHCTPNLEVLFTTDPDKPMAAVLHWAGGRLWTRYPHQIERELKHSAGHAMQGWYITAPGGSARNTDAQLVRGLELRSLWPAVIPNSLHSYDSGRGILQVLLLVDLNQVAGATIGSIADYAAMVGLSLIESPDHCDSLPSILDIMSPTCRSRAEPTGITAGDLAFLKALYYRDTGLGRTLSRDEILRRMHDELEAAIARAH